MHSAAGCAALAVTLAFAGRPATVGAQQAPPVAAASPAPLGAPLGPNDPCTTIGAIVNRPTVTNAVCTVRSGHVEVEGGYQNAAYDGSGNLASYPQLLVRLGTPVRGLEFFVAPPGLQRNGTLAPAVDGTTDVQAGVKYLLGFSPKIATSALVAYGAPSGSAGISADATTSIYALQSTLAVSPAVGVTIGLQDQILAVAGVSYGSFVPSAVVSVQLPQRFSAFAEVAQFTHANGGGTPTRTQFLGGITRQIGDRLQLDAEYGWSPTSATGRYQTVGAGFGYAF